MLQCQIKIVFLLIKIRVHSRSCKHSSMADRLRSSVHLYGYRLKGEAQSNYTTALESNFLPHRKLQYRYRFCLLKQCLLWLFICISEQNERRKHNPCPQLSCALSKFPEYGKQSW